MKTGQQVNVMHNGKVRFSGKIVRIEAEDGFYNGPSHLVKNWNGHAEWLPASVLKVRA